MERVAGDARPASPMHGPNQWPHASLLPGAPPPTHFSQAVMQAAMVPGAAHPRVAAAHSGCAPGSACERRSCCRRTAGWREDAEAAVARLLHVARVLMRALALALALPEDFFTSKCEDPVAQTVLFR